VPSLGVIANQKIYLKNLRKSASSAVKNKTSAHHNRQSSAPAGGAAPIVNYEL
jgi:hypothetical protein